MNPNHIDLEDIVSGKIKTLSSVSLSNFRAIVFVSSEDGYSVGVITIATAYSGAYERVVGLTWAKLAALDALAIAAARAATAFEASP